MRRLSGIYLQNFHGMYKDLVEVVAVCDLIPERCPTAAKAQYNIPFAYYTDEEIMANPDIELIVNLTTPDQHKLVNVMALNAGKHAYCEKPLAVTRQDGEEQVKLAKEKGLMLGRRPGHLPGRRHSDLPQAHRRGLDRHPGGGARLHDLPWPRVLASGSRILLQKGRGPDVRYGALLPDRADQLDGPGEERERFHPHHLPHPHHHQRKKYGQIIEVEVPTHIVGIMNFESGAIGTIVTSFDVWESEQACIELYGSEGSLRVPDPNTFGGPIQLLRPGQKEWENVPVIYGYQENSRGLGVVDMCCAIRQGRKARANSDQTFHVLDLMCAFHDAADQKKTVELKSRFDRQPALPMGLMQGAEIR